VFFLIPTLLAFPSSLLTAASLVVLSMGIARWQRPGKVALIALQALLALLLGGALVVSTLRLPRSSTGTPLDGLFIGGTLATTSGWLLLVLLVVRWECWKHRPLVMACVFAGQLAWLSGRLASLLSGLGLLSSQALGAFSLSYAPSIGQLTPLLFALGILLLIRSERASQSGQGAPITGPAPAIEGGAAGAQVP
jgi:hypothetical protein